MPGRNYQPATPYKYGFNGQEKDDEIKGGGNSYDFMFRIFDSRLGKFLSVDPLEKEFAWNSPYSFAENRVIDGKDLEGKEWDNFMSSFSKPGQLPIKLPNTETANIQQYSISIQDPEKSYEAFKDEFLKSPEKILSNSKAKFHSPVDGEGKPSQFKVGSYIKIDIDGPLNNSYVKVISLKEKDGNVSATFATVEGHLEKGVINFSLNKGKNGEIIFNISSLSEVDEALVPSKIAVPEQKKSWTEVLKNVNEEVGGNGTIFAEPTKDQKPIAVPTTAPTPNPN